MARVLVVDEEQLIGEVIAAALEAGGHRVEWVETESAALEAVTQHAFDVLFLHRMLPRTICDEVVYRARRHGEPHREPYIVLMSSERSAAVEQNKVRLGAAEILYKPLDLHSLRAVLTRYEEWGAGYSVEVPGAPRILVVDDDELVRLSVVEILEDRFEVESTESPVDALERLRQTPFELLITDLQMREMSGIDLLRAARNTRPSMMTIVMTGYGTKSNAVAALKQGAYDFLEKPLTPRLVLRTVERAWKTLRYELENRKLLSELQSMNQELIRAKEAAEAASEAKGRFLAKISHELRTPLHGMLSPLFLLLETGTPRNAKEQKLLELAAQCGQSLLGLVDDLIEVAQVEEPSLSPSDIRPDELFAPLLATYLPQAEAAGLELTLELAPELPTHLHLDPDHLRRALHYLLDNAIKFTQEGSVRLAAALNNGSEDRSMLSITLKDTGIGMPPDLEQTVFDPFTQADDSFHRLRGGTGIGLTLAYRRVQRLGGRLEISSIAGKGSTFQVLIPLA